MDLKYTILYDYYGDLLTIKQKKYFEEYYFDNLSLQEIADNYSVSRNAIHNSLKDILVKLDNYEKVLNLVEKSQKISKLIENIDENVKKQIKELI